MPRAVRFDRYGDIDVLKVVDVERPVPGPGQALIVQVKAASTISPGEASIRQGRLRQEMARDVPVGRGAAISRAWWSRSAKA